MAHVVVGACVDHPVPALSLNADGLLEKRIDEFTGFNELPPRGVDRGTDQP